MGVSERDIMGSPYLNNDESIILSTHVVVINAVPAEMILTTQRLMLVDKTHKKLLPQDIPFAAIETVTIGDNSGNDPVLALSIATPDGTRKPLAVVFPQQPKARREGERDEWAVRLKEQCMAAQEKSGIQPLTLSPPWVPGPLPEEDLPAGMEEVVRPGTRFRVSSDSRRKGRSLSPTGKRIILAATIIIILIAAIAGLMWYAPQWTSGVSTQVPAPAQTQTVTPQPTTVPTPFPTTIATPGITTEPTVAETLQPVSLIPQSGVWVRIRYEGNYTGDVGAPGRFKHVDTSGDQFFQIPAKDETVSASVQKGDNSGAPLTIEFYQDGKMVKSGTITMPGGLLVLSVNLKTTSPSLAPTTLPTMNGTASP